MMKSKSEGRNDRACDCDFVQAHTRLLFPFSFDRRQVKRAASELQSQKFKDRPIWQLWDCESMHYEYYQLEGQQSALASLFGPAGSGRYLSMCIETANSMLSRRVLMKERKNYSSMAFHFVHPAPAAEVFLTPFGVGVLSLTVKLDLEGLESATIDNALIFNYRLSQLRDWATPTIRVPHPEDDPDRLSMIPAAAREGIPPAPSRQAALEQRLNAQGGEYTLPELVKFLLNPLCSDTEFQANASQFSIYAALRLDNKHDFADEETRNQLSSVLSALCQVEEHIHAGSLPGKPGVEHELLNRHHWAAAGCLGAVHLVSDQAPEIAFNEERLQRARDRYFISFLPAYLQRLSIQRASDLIGRTIQVNSPTSLESCAPEFRRILHDLTEFNALSYLSEVSNREVVNRYYRMSQRGLQVRRSWELTTANIANLEAACRVAQQQAQLAETAALLEKQRDILEESKVLHAKVEWVEVFIVAVYFAELVHIVGGSLFDHAYVGWSALIGSTGAMILALLVLRPWHSLQLKGLKLVGLIAFMAMAIFLIVGVLRFSSNSHSNGEQHSPEGIHSHEESGTSPVP